MMPAFGLPLLTPFDRSTSFSLSWSEGRSMLHCWGLDSVALELQITPRGKKVSAIGYSETRSHSSEHMDSASKLNNNSIQLQKCVVFTPDFSSKHAALLRKLVNYKWKPFTGNFICAVLHTHTPTSLFVVKGSPFSLYCFHNTYKYPAVCELAMCVVPFECYSFYALLILHYDTPCERWNLTWLNCFLSTSSGFTVWPSPCLCMRGKWHTHHNTAVLFARHFLILSEAAWVAWETMTPFLQVSQLLHF